MAHLVTGNIHDMMRAIFLPIAPFMLRRAGIQPLFDKNEVYFLLPFSF